jgi:hypothetical protein
VDQEDVVSSYIRELAIEEWSGPYFPNLMFPSWKISLGVLRILKVSGERKAGLHLTALGNSG